jgi:hydroxyacylglutathione hydrolase
MVYKTPMLPIHLSGIEPQGFQTSEPVAQYQLGDLRNFIYLILDWKTKKAAIVDPQSDSTPIEDLNKHGFELVGIFLTHSHHDHVAGVPGLLEKFPNLPIYVHPTDATRLSPNAKRAVKPLADQQSVSVGSLSIKVLHTPGHSAGECCYYFERDRNYLFTGDTLFIRDCGRTDFSDGSNEEMFSSLQKIKRLPPDTIILPGHHYVKECASVLSKELMDSPPLRVKSVAELAALP